MDSHTSWILTQGRMNGLQALIDGLGARLRAGGMDLMRLRLGMRTTHPLTTALSFMWENSGGPIVQAAAPHGLENRSAYVGSPMEHVARTRTPFRRILTGTLTKDDHTVLHELQLRGATDYYGIPLVFVEGSGGILMAVSEAASGFSDDDITLLDTLSQVIAPVAEAHGNHHLATAIATSYLGPKTGQRVLDGQITRGDIETTQAAILFSDIRGWTALNATLPAAEILQIANRYFEIISDAVDSTGGEILKFMGDGVLALFPSDSTGRGRKLACRNAVAAAHAAQGIAADTDRFDTSFGIGIHFGEVLYGNVGAHARIDFTILGQAVNIASRVESSCADLGQSVLVSDTVAKIADLPMQHVSTQPLKGVEYPMALHTPVNS